MHFKTAWAIFITSVSAFLVFGSPGPEASSAVSCPDIAVVQERLSNAFQGRNVTAKAIEPSPVSGLCQVHVRVNEKSQILYTDPSGRYLILGQILDAQEKKNLTRARLEEFNRLTAQDKEALDDLVAFTLGPATAPHTVYFVTDPQCPYCKRAETTLEAMASEGVLQVRYVLYPLPMHPGARESCIALVCDKKGHDDFKKNYKSDNQCPEGTNKIDATMKFMQAHGINGTPTYIFSDGTFRSGVMDRSALENKLKAQ
ncbi:DsbC family protein [Desulfosoma caldarium]|uniref:Thiol:disulfide interchange protein DsbC n=1 Tax=Desulfosoma caldarium TaxID=610254 RepID=A0A3N1VPV6_9BACT|nr:DsbC family protein [Desulfosoma caldarium]ROR01927.1 thiol:disulfide interchange protein DsbC [Desulfosoma caldarium]